MEELIRSLLEPITEELDVDILKISLGNAGKNQLLRVIIDRAGGVDSDVLERVSRGLALQMDAEDLIAGAYRLEVTSPGLDWPFETTADFVRYRGEWVKIYYNDGREIEGRNLGPVEEGVSFELSVEGQKRPADNRKEVVSLDEVTKVIRAINWKEVSRKK